MLRETKAWPHLSVRAECGRYSLNPRRATLSIDDVRDQAVTVRVADPALAESLTVRIREAGCVVEQGGSGWLRIVIPDALEAEARAALQFYLATWTTAFDEAPTSQH